MLDEVKVHMVQVSRQRVSLEAFDNVFLPCPSVSSKFPRLMLVGKISTPTDPSPVVAS